MQLFALPDSPNQDEAADIIKRVFALTNDEGTPGYIVDYLADQYYQGQPRSVAEVVDGVFEGLTVSTDQLADGVAFEEVTDPSEALAGFSEFLADLKATLDRIYALDTKAVNDQASAAELIELKELKAEIESVPPVIFGLFPPKEFDTKWGSLSASEPLKVPQAIALAIFIVDKYMAERLVESYDYDNETGEVEVNAGVDFDATALMSLWGLVLDPEDENFDETLLEDFASVDIYWLEVHPNLIFDPGIGEEVPMLFANTCVDTFAVGDDFEITSVKLVYPTAGGGTGEADMISHAELYEDGWMYCYSLDPWAYSETLVEDFTSRADDGREFTDWNELWATVLSDPNAPIVKDFVTGSYSVEVAHSQVGDVSQSSSEDFYFQMIKGLAKVNPVLTYPTSEPKWPGETATEAQYDAYYEAMNNYAMTTVSVAAGSDAVSGMIINWDDPVFPAGAELPDGITAVYNIDLGRDICMLAEDGSGRTDCYWEHLFSTWETDERVVGNAYQLPIDLPALSLEESPYHLNISVEFIDIETGKFVGQGGWAHAAFRVGETVDATATTAIVGEVDLDSLDSVPVDSELRIALLAESCYEDLDKWYCDLYTIADTAVAEDGSYVLRPSIDDLTVPSDTWISVRAYLDAPYYEYDEATDEEVKIDRDGMLTEFEETWTDEDGVEHTYNYYEYMQWSNDWINFHRNGGVLYADGGSCTDGGSGDYECDYWYQQVLPVGDLTEDADRVLQGPYFEFDDTQVPDEGPKFDPENAGGDAVFTTGTSIDNTTVGFEGLPTGVSIRNAIDDTNGVIVSWTFDDIMVWDETAQMDVSQAFEPTEVRLKLMAVSAGVLDEDFAGIDMKDFIYAGVEFNVWDEGQGMPTEADLSDYMADDALYVLIIEAWDDMGYWQETAPQFITLGDVTADPMTLRVVELADPLDPWPGLEDDPQTTEVDESYATFTVAGDIDNYDAQEHVNFLPMLVVEECGQSANGGWYCETMPVAVGEVLGDSTDGYYYEMEISFEGLYFGDDIHYDVRMFEDFIDPETGEPNGTYDVLGYSPQGHPWYEPTIWAGQPEVWLDHWDGLKMVYNNCDENGCSNVWAWELLLDGTEFPGPDFDLDGWDSQAPEPPKPEFEVMLALNTVVDADPGPWQAVIDDDFVALTWLNQDTATGPTVEWELPEGVVPEFTYVAIMQIGVEAFTGEGSPQVIAAAGAKVTVDATGAPINSLALGNITTPITGVEDITSDLLSGDMDFMDFSSASALTSYSADSYYVAMVTPMVMGECHEWDDQLMDYVLVSCERELAEAEPVIWGTGDGSDLPSDLPEFLVTFDPINEFPEYMFEDPWSGERFLERFVGPHPTVHWGPVPAGLNFQHVMVFEMDPAFLRAPEEMKDDSFGTFVDSMLVVGVPPEFGSINLGNVIGVAEVDITMNYLQDTEFVAEMGIEPDAQNLQSFVIDAFDEDGLYFVMVRGYVLDDSVSPAVEVEKMVSDVYTFVVGDGILEDGSAITDEQPVHTTITIAGDLNVPNEGGENYVLRYVPMDCGPDGCFDGADISGVVDAVDQSFSVAGVSTQHIWHSNYRLELFDDANQNGMWDDGEAQWHNSWYEGHLFWQDWVWDEQAQEWVTGGWFLESYDENSQQWSKVAVATDDTVELGMLLGEYMDNGGSNPDGGSGTHMQMDVDVQLSALTGAPVYHDMVVETAVALDPVLNWSYSETNMPALDGFSIVIVELAVDTPASALEQEASDTFVNNQVLGSVVLEFDAEPASGTLSSLFTAATSAMKLDEFPTQMQISSLEADKFYMWQVHGHAYSSDGNDSIDYELESQPSLFTTGDASYLTGTATDDWLPVHMSVTLAGDVSIADDHAVDDVKIAVMSEMCNNSGCTETFTFAGVTLVQNGFEIAGTYSAVVDTSEIYDDYSVVVWVDTNANDVLDDGEAMWNFWSGDHESDSIYWNEVNSEWNKNSDGSLVSAGNVLIMMDLIDSGTMAP
jgi:hypothetical protein